MRKIDHGLYIASSVTITRLIYVLLSKTRVDRIDPLLCRPGPRQLPLRGSVPIYQTPYVFSRADSNVWVGIPVPTYAENTVLQFLIHSIFAECEGAR